MFSVFEKIRFIISTKLSLRAERKADAKDKNNDKPWVRAIKRLAKIITIVFVLFFALGLFVSYSTAPTISVADSNDGVIRTDTPRYIMKGRVISGNESSLRINGQEVELIGGDFVFETSLEEGDNKFTLEASNNHGTTKEIHIVRLLAPAKP